MRSRGQTGPPRALVPGDVVVTFSDLLGEWTAGQITDVDARERTVGVLDLDWSGPEPRSLVDLGEPRPLLLTHHGYRGEPSQLNVPWLLPRSYRVLGRLPVLAEPCLSYATWRVGLQLFLQRRWDSGDHESSDLPGVWEGTQLEYDDQPPGGDVHSLLIHHVRRLDCRRLVERLPGLRSLRLLGPAGLLDHADALNELGELRSVQLHDVHGLAADDVLRPDRLAHLESLTVESVLADYASTTKSLWRPLEPEGVELVVRSPRTPEWIRLNAANPLRDWDGRDHIPAASHKKAIARWRASRVAVLAALEAGSTPERLVDLGREFAEAFNLLDRRSGFIGTEEREELLEALVGVVDEAEKAGGATFPGAREALAEGVDAVRAW